MVINVSKYLLEAFKLVTTEYYLFDEVNNSLLSICDMLCIVIIINANYTRNHAKCFSYAFLSPYTLLFTFFLLVSWLIAQKKNYLCDLLEDKFIAPEKAMEIYIYHLDGALCIK